MKRVRTHPSRRSTFSMIDLYDTVLPELDRLHAITDLLTSTTDNLEMTTAHGIALILHDIQHRTKAILETALKKHQKAR